ncbi:unnamed protein product, partial [Effrenium voratum]
DKQSAPGAGDAACAAAPPPGNTLAAAPCGASSSFAHDVLDESKARLRHDAQRCRGPELRLRADASAQGGRLRWQRAPSAHRRVPPLHSGGAGRGGGPPAVQPIVGYVSGLLRLRGCPA